MTISFAIDSCPLGNVLVAQSPKGICAILLGDEQENLYKDVQLRFPNNELVKADDASQHIVAHVIRAIEQPKHSFNLPLDVRGTTFQQRVWQALQQIPAGETRSYSDMAKTIGAPNAVRAVAGACAANSIAVIIPCHRVIRSDGQLSGYRWGLERKVKLLQLEKDDLESASR